MNEGAGAPVERRDAGGRGQAQYGARRTDRPCSSVAEHSLGKGEVERSIRSMGTRVKAGEGTPLR